MYATRSPITLPIGTLPRPSSNTSGARLASGMTTVSVGPYALKNALGLNAARMRDRCSPVSASPPVMIMRTGRISLRVASHCANWLP
ncbi:hypothetical protein D3C72_1448460 [compost metagenome]